MWELPKKPNHTLSAPPDRTEFRASGGDRILWDGKSYPAALFAVDAWQRRRSRGASFSPATPPRSATRATPTRMLQCRNLRADARLIPSSDGSDVTLSSELPPNFQMQPMFSSVGSSMTGRARSSRGAPVCASLERAASAKSSPLLLAWVADNRQCSHLWTNARFPSQRLDRWPPRLRGQELHGRHYRIRVECESCVTTCPSGQPLCGGDS